MTELHTILYVEDDADIQEVAKLALEVLGGFEVWMASSGEEAVERAARQRPDLVLLDVMMPGMDGPTTLVALRGIEGMADVPVVFVTAKVQAAEVAEYTALGAVGVIAKPFDPMTLAQQARDLWQSASATRP
jgi:two-component system, OmpR family, response regulator